MITRNKGLFPSAERLRQLLAMAKGHALPKQTSIKASKKVTHITALLFQAGKYALHPISVAGD
jgi:hypothetical protein